MTETGFGLNFANALGSFGPREEQIEVFSTIDELGEGLRLAGYIADRVTISTIYLAARLRKPLLLEGPAGSGKTQLAYSVAAAAATTGGFLS